MTRRLDPFVSALNDYRSMFGAAAIPHVFLPAAVPADRRHGDCGAGPAGGGCARTAGQGLDRGAVLRPPAAAAGGGE